MPAKIPNVNEHRRIPMRRIPMRAIRTVAKQIADKFQPDKIIRFGSYAYGKPRPESDVDSARRHGHIAAQHRASRANRSRHRLP